MFTTNNNLLDEKELNAIKREIKENSVDIEVLKNDIVDFTMENLQDYCNNNHDNPDRIIARASEILIGRHSYEFNSIISQLCAVFNPSYEGDDPAGDFDRAWREHGLDLF